MSTRPQFFHGMVIHKNERCAVGGDLGLAPLPVSTPISTLFLYPSTSAMVSAAVLSYLLAGAVFSFTPNVEASPIGVDMLASAPVGQSTVVTAMTAAQETSYTPAALFASAAACPASETITWSYGGESSEFPSRRCRSSLEGIQITHLLIAILSERELSRVRITVSCHAFCREVRILIWTSINALVKLAANCDVLPNFVPYGSGGDGDATQYCEYIHKGPTRTNPEGIHSH